MDRGRSPISNGRQHRPFRARSRAMVSWRVPMATGAGSAMIVITTGAGGMGQCAVMSRICRLCRRRLKCRGLPPFKHRGVVRRLRIRTIGDPRRCAFSHPRSEATNADHRLQACPSKGALRSPCAKCRHHAVFRRPRVASSDPRWPILAASSTRSRPIPGATWSVLQSMWDAALSGRAIGRRLAVPRGAAIRVGVKEEDRASGSAERGRSYGWKLECRFHQCSKGLECRMPSMTSAEMRGSPVPSTTLLTFFSPSMLSCTPEI